VQEHHGGDSGEQACDQPDRFGLANNTHLSPTSDSASSIMPGALSSRRPRKLLMRKWKTRSDTSSYRRH
jgi:hypothetical protein